MRSLVVIAALLALCSLAQADKCSVHTTCGTCMLDPSMPDCGWCDAEGECRSASLANGCTLRQSKSEIEVTQNDAFTDNGANSVMVRPQAVTATLRPGEEKTFTITVQPVANYPLDLYMLMDLSGSMGDDIYNLQRAAKNLADAVGALAGGDVHLGFGSFVDKPAAPITRTECYFGSSCSSFCCTSAGNKRRRTYLFENTVPLAKQNSANFKSQIEATFATGNADDPEGGLDGLLQVAVCKDKIGWRDQSRKIVFFASDADFHYGGDGKVMGIYEPNDGTCRMGKRSGDSKDGLDQSAAWSIDSQQDYPTIGQIRNVLEEADIVPVFAAAYNSAIDYGSTRYYYDRMVSLLGRGFSSSLASDSSNIVSLVLQAYDQIVGSLQVYVASGETAHYVKSITYRGANSQKTPPEASVEGAKVKVQYPFVVTMLSGLPVQPDESQQFKTEEVTIKTLGLGETVVTVKHRVSCDCERVTRSAGKCKNGGEEVCGACQCDDGFVGATCACEAGTSFNQPCAVDDATGEECGGSAQGTCECGACVCRKGSDGNFLFSGESCGCKTTCKKTSASAVQGGGLECGGPEQGECDCGECKCNSSWNGDDECGCPVGAMSEKFCTPDRVANFFLNQPLPCNGAATCECGKCGPCKPGYSGENCADCNPLVANDCPAKTKSCAEAASCGDCFDPSVVGNDKCNWCPGNAGIFDNNNQPLKPRCVPAESGNDACKCAEQTESFGVCNLHTKSTQCIDCKSKQFCNDCKSAIREEALPGIENVPGACDWCNRKGEVRCFPADEEGEKLCGIGFTLLGNNTCPNNSTGETCVGALCVPTDKVNDECNGPKEARTLPQEFFDQFCPDSPSPLPIILGVIFGVLAAILLALLAWKIWAHMADKREWERWEKERSQSKWQASQNPLFKSSTTEYQNPVYSHG